MDPFHHLNTSFSSPYHPLLSPSPPHHPHFPPLPPPPPLPEPPQLPSSAAASLERERLPQWSHAETAAFLAVRADLDHSFLTTKRNKALWEAVSARLHAQGFARTPDQCKSKWKNLVTRFKGTEAAAAAAAGAAVVDPASAAGQSQQQQQPRPQFPFHDEVRRIFDARAEHAQALERKRAKGKGVRDDEGAGEGEDVEDEEEDDEIEADAAAGGDEDAAGAGRASGGAGTKKRRRKQQQQAASRAAADQGEVEAMLREFMRRQAEMEER